MQHEGGFNPVFILKRMRHDFSECTLFAFFKDGICFLGATPERLVSLEEGNRIQVSCLAGSTGLRMGSKEDLELKERLLLDPKNRLEHALVVDAIRKALEPVCKKLAFPSSPAIVSMKNIRHLHTPLLGILGKKEGCVLELVGLLHPTPAVGGLPKERAISLIRGIEGFDRGWYSGPVGWIDGSGGGAMFVAIRCALLSAYEALLYAGCGIVADSNPEEELEESRLKLKAMQWMLNGKT
jgi:isochorismate synthase